MDPVSVGLLASATVKVLGPYLEKLADEAGGALIGKASEGAADGAFKAVGNLWKLVRNKFRGKDQAEKSLEALTFAPQDPAAQAAVEKALTTELQHDPEFASALSGQLTQIANTETDVAFVNNIQGDVEKIANFGTVHGDVTF